MTLWFGEPWPRPDWRAPVCEDDANRIPVPLGSTCFQCGELIDEDDQGCAYPSVVAGPDGEPVSGGLIYDHRECGMRSILGCSAHLRGEGHDHDLPYREDARRVMAWIEEHPL